MQIRYFIKKRLSTVAYLEKKKEFVKNVTIANEKDDETHRFYVYYCKDLQPLKCSKSFDERLPTICHM